MADHQVVKFMATTTQIPTGSLGCPADIHGETCHGHGECVGSNDFCTCASGWKNPTTADGIFILGIGDPDVRMFPCCAKSVDVGVCGTSQVQLLAGFVGVFLLVGLFLGCLRYRGRMGAPLREQLLLNSDQESPIPSAPSSGSLSTPVHLTGQMSWLFALLRITDPDTVTRCLRIKAVVGPLSAVYVRVSFAYALFISQGAVFFGQAAYNTGSDSVDCSCVQREWVTMFRKSTCTPLPGWESLVWLPLALEVCVLAVCALTRQHFPGSWYNDLYTVLTGRVFICPESGDVFPSKPIVYCVFPVVAVARFVFVYNGFFFTFATKVHAPESQLRSDTCLHTVTSLDLGVIVASMLANIPETLGLLIGLFVDALCVRIKDLGELFWWGEIGLVTPIFKWAVVALFLFESLDVEWWVFLLGILGAVITLFASLALGVLLVRACRACQS